MGIPHLQTLPLFSRIVAWKLMRYPKWLLIFPELWQLPAISYTSVLDSYNPIYGAITPSISHLQLVFLGPQLQYLRIQFHHFSFQHGGSEKEPASLGALGHHHQTDMIGYWTQKGLLYWQF